MPRGKEKLRLWIQFGKRYNCLHKMPEIEELYQGLKRDGFVTMSDWNNYMDEKVKYEYDYVVRYICDDTDTDYGCNSLEDAERIAKGLVLVSKTEISGTPEISILNVESGEVKSYIEEEKREWCYTV